MRRKPHPDCRVEYARLMKKGLGCGRFEQYQPALFVRDVPSCACKYRVFSPRFKRVFTFFSSGEYLTFLILEWNMQVAEVREQFPLDPSVTLAIAEELGIKHPGYTHGGNGIVMTTDFVVTLQRPNGAVETKAIQIKHSKQDLTPRTQEKLQIEREYWKRRGVAWQLFLSAEFNQCFCRNLQLLMPLRLVLDPALLQEISRRADRLLHCPGLSYAQCGPLLSLNVPQLGRLDGCGIVRLLTAQQLWHYRGLKEKFLPLAELREFRVGGAA